MEELKIAEDVGFDFVRVGLAVELLQFGDELRDRVLAVAAEDDFEAGAVEAQGAFGHEQNFLALVFAEADTGGELWFAVEVDSHAGKFTVQAAGFTARSKVDVSDWWPRRRAREAYVVGKCRRRPAIEVANHTKDTRNAFCRLAMSPGSSEK